MAKVRFIKTMEELMQQAQQRAAAGPLQTESQSIVIEYLSDPEAVKAVVPKPLVPNNEGRMQACFGYAKMQVTPDVAVGIGTWNFVAHVTYEGQPGTYVVGMAFDDEMTVITGREIYGEPKKLAAIKFDVNGDDALASVTRHGIPFAAFKGKLGGKAAPGALIDNAYTFKFTLKPDGTGFDHDPQMLRLVWKHQEIEARDITGELVLTESPFDPVIDLPVRQLVSARWSKRLTSSMGENVCTVSPMEMFPFISTRYDDIAAYASKGQ
jgi:acetoacetate decarboxylase